MALTPAQLQALKTYIASVPAWAALPNDSDAALQIASGMNEAAAPAWVVWRSSVPTLDIGRAVSYVAVAAMTTANLDRVKTFYAMNPTSFEPSRSDIRTFMADTFSGALGGAGQASRDALDALYRRNATLAEKALSTGTGSTASPATLGYEGAVSYADVQAARSA